MSVYEQQSTFNPNIPVRELMYAGRLYDKYIHKHHLNIYGKKLVRMDDSSQSPIQILADTHPDMAVKEIRRHLVQCGISGNTPCSQLGH